MLQPSVGARRLRKAIISFHHEFHELHELHVLWIRLYFYRITLIERKASRLSRERDFEHGWRGFIFHHRLHRLRGFFRTRIARISRIEWHVDRIQFFRISQILSERLRSFRERIFSNTDDTDWHGLTLRSALATLRSAKNSQLSTDSQLSTLNS